MTIIKFRSIIPVLFLSLLTGLFLDCKPIKPIQIALSRSSKNYVSWLKQCDSTLVLKDLDSMPIPMALKTLNKCSGLLLTGGEDVYPGWFGKTSDTGRCTDMNLLRDTLEMALIAKAIEMKMPIFGICRGHQILNVYLNGRNIIDIPKDFDTTIQHQCEDYLHCFHPVYVIRESYLARISGCDSAEVTTNHHQGIEILSPLLKASARTKDGLIEGIEWANPKEKSFLIGVQWHPERMENSNPLSGTLAKEFIFNVSVFSNRINKQ